MSPEETVEQIQRIIATLQRIVTASSDLAKRTEMLEESARQSLSTLTSIQGTSEVMLRTFESYTDAQTKLNTQLAQALAKLEARVAVLEGREGQGGGGLVM